MDKGLLKQALTKYFLGLVLLGVLLFLPAWSFKYWQGWLLMGILFVPMFVAGLVMMAKSPELLRKRLNVKEQEAEQKTVMATTVLFLAMPLVLASPISFFIMLGYIPVIAKRIKNEEKVLEEGLDGYVDYEKKVKYRILPYIW